MSDQSELMAHARRIKAAHQDMLMRKANVVGVAIGYAQRAQIPTKQISVVVMVSQKLPRELLDVEDIIPSELEGIPVDVQEVGKLRAIA
jgi:hypothetical protein